MITTVTTTTTTIAMTASTASLSLIAILTLIGLLIQKEICSGLESPRARNLSQALNVAIVPLVVVFITMVVFKVIDTLH